MGTDKTKQLGLSGMPKLDKVGKAAKKYLAAREGVDTAKADYTSAAMSLVNELRKSKRQQIKVEGVTITLKHVVAQDLLKVTKPKEK